MANVKIKPIGDRVLVEHIEEKEQVRGGIIIAYLAQLIKYFGPRDFFNSINAKNSIFT